MLALLVAVLILSGCAPTPAPTESASPDATSSPAPSVSPTKEPPTLQSDGSATDNLPYFRGIVDQVWATEARVQGRAYVDALVGAGFDKAAMQVTNDSTTIGNPAESIQFSVLWGEECLIGQVGPATGEPVATVVDALEGGVCLVGRTRPIDW